MKLKSETPISVPGSEEFEVAVLAPFARDSAAAAELLTREGVRVRELRSVGELCERLHEPLGAALIAEEAFTRESLEILRAALLGQPAWSNLPIILLTSQKDRVLSTESILQLLGTSGSITLLERPSRIVTLLTAVRVALQTRRRQYEVRALLEEQARAVEKQRAAVQKRDDFLSMASHELKTPITSMKLQMQIRKRLLSRGDQQVLDPERVQGMIRFMETQVNRMAHLVDDMLDVSRIENGKLTLNCEPVELGALVGEVLGGFQDQFEAAGCAVDFAVNGPAAGLWDPYRIEQVVANLFTNVLRYGPGRPVQIRVEAEGGRAQLTVRDQGMGIAPEHQQRIFERFERAVPGINLSGLGLGLFITRQILDLHGGAITVESTLGEGATFTVTLPLPSR